MQFNIGISIICSNYNSIEWIDGYLEALNKQYYPNFEIIFIDAKSTDGSLEKIKEFRFKPFLDTRIIELDTRVSVYEAWNIGINVAEGDWIMNLNTDDRIFSSTLYTYSLYARNYPEIDVFYSPCLVASDIEHNQIVAYNNWPEYSHEQLLEACMCGPFPLVRKKAIIEAGMFDTKYFASGDYAMWLKMSKMGKRFFKIREPLGSYYHNPKGLSTDLSRLADIVAHDRELRKIYA